MKNEIAETERLLEISKRIDLMREQYARSNHYEKFFLKKDGTSMQKGLNISIGKLKSKLKKKYYFDDFYVLVIDKLF